MVHRCELGSLPSGDLFLFRLDSGGTGGGVLDTLGPSHGSGEANLGCEGKARSRERRQWRRAQAMAESRFVRRSEKGKNEVQG